MELSKRDKKIARQIIEIGLQKEFAKGLYNADSVLNDWKEKVRDNRESYHLLYKAINNFDKHIARRYDSMSGSKYAWIIAAQLGDEMISESDLAELSENVRQAIIHMSRL